MHPLSAMRALGKALYTCCLVLPLGLLFGGLIFALWLLATLTGIGPIYHHIRRKREQQMLASFIEPAQGAVVKLFTLPGTERRLAVRWSPGSDPTLPPICIPNGLGATLMTIGSLHDLLAQRGYPVLTYDRAGVGFSDPLPPSQTHHATAADVVADMKLVLDGHVGVGGRRPWVLVGPSMGSVVAQAYMAEHPGDVIGFLNMDGFPFPFAAKRDKFIKAGGIYSTVAKIIWTGLLRPFMALASSKMAKLATLTFPLDAILAQMNTENFYASLSREMHTMMDLSSAVLSAWGMAFDIAAMDPEERRVLINAQPHACGDFTVAKGWSDLPRAPVEVGDDWTPQDKAAAMVARLLDRAKGKGGSAPFCPLPKLWPRLVVRVMSARDYNFGAGSDFYDDDMKAWASAEHNLHAYLAKDGRRTVFPLRNHNNMFFTLTEFIAKQVDEIAASLSGPAKAANRV